MTDVKIKITEVYHRIGVEPGDGKFTTYSWEYLIPDINGGGGLSETLKEIAKIILFRIVRCEINNPNYGIILSDGVHPLKDCSKNCYHTDFTKKPGKSLQKELTDLLNDEKLISEAKNKVKEYEK